MGDAAIVIAPEVARRELDRRARARASLRGRHPVLAHLGALDDALAARGFPRISPWWRNVLERFYAGTARQLVLRVGRRGGKSSTLARVGVLEALYGEHRVPPGDVGVVAIVSTTRDEAAQRLRTVRAILDALGVRTRPIDHGLELYSRPVAIKTFVATIAGVSGFSCICAICDEVAKWRDSDTGANPAREVLASFRPTLATQPSARIFLSSSPLGRLDAHAAAFDAGSGATQQVAHAESWIANPSLSEAETRALEPDDARWLREYAAVPLEESDSGLLTASMVDRATRAAPGDVGPEPGVSYVAAMDPAFVRNGWTLVVAGKRRVSGRIVRSIVLAREWRGTTSTPLDPDRVLGEIAALVAPYGVMAIDTDQYERFGLQSIAGRPSIGLYVRNPTGASMLARYEALATHFADGGVELPPDRTLRADLLAIRRRLTPNGFTISLPDTPDGRHADYAPAVALALAAASVDPVDPRPQPRRDTEAWAMAALEREIAQAKAAREDPFAVALPEVRPPWVR